MKDANEILNDAQTVHERVKPYLRDAAEFFHDNETKLFKRGEAKKQLAEELGIEESLAGEVIAQLVSDKVDPVIQIPHGRERFVGVVEYKEFDGAYGYVDYDDVQGQRKRVVCQQCVNDATHDNEVAHATANARVDGEVRNPDASYEDLVEKIHEHYEVHDAVPSEVETGAELASETTIGGNIAFHGGNATVPWSDSGTDNSSGGNLYELPQTSDGVDIGSANIGSANIGGLPFSTYKGVIEEGDGWTDEVHTVITVNGTSWGTVVSGLGGVDAIGWWRNIEVTFAIHAVRITYATGATETFGDTTTDDHYSPHPLQGVKIANVDDIEIFNNRSNNRDVGVYVMTR